MSGELIAWVLFLAVLLIWWLARRGKKVRLREEESLANYTELEKYMEQKVDQEHLMKLATIMSGTPEAIKSLLDSGANPNACDEHSLGFLHWSVRLGRVDAVKILLDAGADVNIQANDGATPLSDATYAATNSTDLMEILLDAGADHSTRDSRGATPLWSAACGTMSLQDVDNVKLLLKNGADPNAADSAGTTPLLIAAKLGVVGVMSELIAAGADVNRQNVDGIASIHHAVESKIEEKVLVLLDAGANPNCKLPNGWTPLHLAALCNDLQITRILLNSGADPNMRCNEDESPLTVAVNCSYSDVVETLIEGGAIGEEGNHDNSSPSNDSIIMTRVSSSNVHSIGYDGALNILYIQFTGGGLYAYGGVGREIFQEFLNAPSKGKYFSVKIRNKYQHIKL